MAASPIASGSGSQAGDENDPLELTSLDADSLFAALGAVEKVSQLKIHRGRVLVDTVGLNMLRSWRHRVVGRRSGGWMESV